LRIGGCAPGADFDRCASAEFFELAQQSTGGVDHERNDMESFREHRSAKELESVTVGAPDAVFEHPQRTPVSEVLIDELQQLPEHLPRL